MLFIINYYIINAMHIKESAGDKPGWPTLSSPDIITPRHPSGFTATGANILIPEVTKKDIITDIDYDDLPDDLHSKNTTSKEPAYRWANPAAALNRVIAEAELNTLRKSFRPNLADYSEPEAVLETLNSRLPDAERGPATSEFYDLLGEIGERVNKENLDSPGLWGYLDFIADYLSIEHDMEDLPMTDRVLELCLDGLEVSTTDNSKLLDFISHFDIPEVLADKLIDSLSVNSDHPLYWWVASRAPHHPDVVRQKSLVNLALEKTVPILNIEDMLPLGSLDLNLDWPRTGLDFEVKPRVSAVKAPKGTLVGEDMSSGTYTQLELRLDHTLTSEVLNYDDDWLKRYFEIWRWEKASRSSSQSIHIHSEVGQDLAAYKIAHAHLLFGNDVDDCRYNELGTMEVRTALPGYAQDKVELGYKSLPPPSLIELLHLAGGDNHVLSSLSANRVMTTDYQSRITAGGKKLLFDMAAENLANQNYDKVNKSAIDNLLSASNSTPFAHFYFNDVLLPHIQSLSPEHRQQVIANSLENPSSISQLIPLIPLMGYFTAEQKQQLFETVMSSNYLKPTSLLMSYDSLNQEQKKQLDERLIADMQGHSASFHLRGYIEQVSPEVQRSYIDQLRKSGYSQIARSVHIRSLPPEDQLAEVRRQLESGDIKQTLSEEDMPFFSPEVQIELMKRDTSDYTTIKIIQSDRPLDPEVELRVIDQLRSYGDALRKASRLNYLSPALQFHVVKDILSTADDTVFEHLHELIREHQWDQSSGLSLETIQAIRNNPDYKAFSHNADKGKAHYEYNIGRRSLTTGT